MMYLCLCVSVHAAPAPAPAPRHIATAVLRLLSVDGQPAADHWPGGGY